MDERLDEKLCGSQFEGHCAPKGHKGKVRCRTTLWPQQCTAAAVDAVGNVLTGTYWVCKKTGRGKNRKLRWTYVA